MPKRQKNVCLRSKRKARFSKSNHLLGLQTDRSLHGTPKTNNRIPVFDKPNLNVTENIPFLSCSEKQLGETVINMLLFVKDPSKQTAFEGHDMVQRFLCGLYQISYPTKNKFPYTLGKVDGNIDFENRGRFVHDLAKKLVYDHPMGIHTGIENFSNLIVKGISIVSTNPNEFNLEESNQTFSEKDLADYIGGEFLQIAAKYKQAVLRTLTDVVQSNRTFDKFSFFVKNPSENHIENLEANSVAITQPNAL